MVKRYLGLIGAVMILCSASISLVAAETKEELTGYLGPEIYAKLSDVEVRKGIKVRRWVGPKLNFANFKSVLVDDVIFHPEPEPGPQVSAETLDAVRASLTGKLRDKIGTVLNLSSAPGPEVLRLQVAITGVEIKTEGMKVYEVLPIAAVFGGLKALTGTREREVQVFLEFKVSDSETGEVIGAAVRRVTGENLENARQQLKLDHIVEDLEAVAVETQNVLSEMLAEPR